MASSSSTALVPLRGGVVVDVTVVRRLIDLEARGFQFTLQPGGRFRVDPAHALTAEDVTFLREHRDAARLVLEYSAPEPVH